MKVSKIRNPFGLWFASVFLLLFLGQCASHKQLKYSELKNTQIDSTLVDDSAIDSIVEPFKKELDRQMNVVLNQADTDLENHRPESKLGNLVADLSLDVANQYYQPDDKQTIDFCLLNTGGLRTSIPKGPITLSTAFQVMPFENELVVITLSSEKVKELFGYLADKGGEPISGATMIIQDSEPFNVLINGKPINESKNYKVVTSDYLARGGDKMYFFSDPINSEKVGIKLRDAIILYFNQQAENGKTINSKLDGRIKYEQ